MQRAVEDFPRVEIQQEKLESECKRQQDRERQRTNTQKCYSGAYLQVSDRQILRDEKASVLCRTADINLKEDKSTEADREGEKH